MTTLQATLRNNESADALRKLGKIPAVIYGKTLPENIPLAVEREAFKKAWSQAGSSTAVTITGAGDDHDVIIHDFQIDPVTDQVIHADFLALDKNTKVTVAVELEYTGEAPAVKSGLGVLEKLLHEIHVEALPKNLPKSIIVDVSGLVDESSQIAIKDLVIPQGVTVVDHDAEDLVAVIASIKEETEESSTPIDFSAIEVEKKGKKEDESEEA